MDIQRPTISERLLLRPSEAAALIGVSRAKMYELISRGVVPSVTVDGSIRIPLRDLEAWVDQQLRPRRKAFRGRSQEPSAR